MLILKALIEPHIRDLGVSKIKSLYHLEVEFLHICKGRNPHFQIKH